MIECQPCRVAKMPTRTAVKEFFDVVTTAWIPVCDNCAKQFMQMARQSDDLARDYPHLCSSHVPSVNRLRHLVIVQTSDNQRK